MKIPPLNVMDYTEVIYLYLYFAFRILLSRNGQNTYVIHNELDVEIFP
jgi:hypothetical protein